MAYDPNKRNGWARGLIHFHTRFSDGWASVLRAGEIAVRQGFDFLIITDHIRDLKLKTRKTVPQYIAACDDATTKLGIPIIPGGELEVNWKDVATSDFSQAHTLALSIRALAEANEFDWIAPGTDPFAHWQDSEGGRGTILAVQEKLRQYNLPPLAAHQFQHVLMSMKRGQDSDYRYDLEHLGDSGQLDFFYSGSVELMHEAEDALLVNRYAAANQTGPKAVYASCDFHVGPQARMPMQRLLDHAGVPRLVRWGLRKIAPQYIRLKVDPEATASPDFAGEQLSHATYVYLGASACTEENALKALRDGQTCVTRGTAEFAGLAPQPSLAQVYQSPVELCLNLPLSYSSPRPRSVIVFRDGDVVHWETCAVAEQSINLKWTDQGAPPGIHNYQIYVPSKFLSSAVRFSV